MATVQKNIVCENFYKEYITLTDTKKNSFSRLCNKLLNDNFIYASKDEDKNDYYEILSLKSLIENYFSLMNFDLVHIDTYKIFYIQTNADRNRIKLKKLDTVILLELRLLYQETSLNVNSSSNITIKTVDMINGINNVISKRPIKEYMDSLRLLKRYKIIDFNFNELNDDNIITIYPTILYIVKIDNINALNEKIKTYLTINGEEDNEIEEDKID